MWSALRPVALQASRATTSAGTLPAARSIASRVVLNRTASCAYRLTVTVRGMATDATAAAAAADPRAEGKPAAKKATRTRTKTAAKAKGTQKTKAVKAKAKPKPVEKKKPRKVVSPEKKLASEKRALKEKALLKSEPKRLPVTSWVLYLSQNLKISGGDFGGAASGASNAYKLLSTSEVQKLRETAHQNHLANKAAYKVWVESHTPQQIHEANLARSRLVRVHKEDLAQIKDERAPKRPVTPYMHFLRSKFGARGSEADIVNFVKDVAVEWNSLSEAERQPFLDMGKAETARYAKEKEAIGFS